MNLTVVALSSTAVQASWDAPPSDLQNGLIVDYVLVVSGVDTDEAYELYSGADISVRTLSGLHPFYTYTFSIAALTIGVSPFSPAVVFKMPEEGRDLTDIQNILYASNITIIFFFFVVCMASVEDVSVEVESASSVTVSWLPPDIQFWNGIITSYTVVYELLGMVDNAAESDNLEPQMTQSFLIPQLGTPLANDPDPRIVTLPLQSERALIQLLEEFYVYRFTVYLNNSIGQSNASSSVVVELPPSGNSKMWMPRIIVGCSPIIFSLFLQPLVVLQPASLLLPLPLHQL